MARATNQPTYDFLTGDEQTSIRPAREPFRETLRQPSAASREYQNEELRVQVKRLQYELDSIKQEREVIALQHEEELRKAHERVEDEIKQATTKQTGPGVNDAKVKVLQKEFRDLEQRAANEKLALEKKVRDLQSGSRELREEVEDAKAELAESTRRQQRSYAELELRYDTLKGSVDDVQNDLSEKSSALLGVQQQLVEKERESGELENEILRLKALTGDTDTLNLIKKELSDQVDYIRGLESTNRAQLAELKQYKKTVKSVEVVEEEKRALETRLRAAEKLRQELAEAQLQRRILEDEKKSWTSYLDAEGAGDETRFNTPEEMAKALMQERLQRLDLVDQLGRIQPELSVRDDNIRSLEEELAKIRNESSDFRRSISSTAPDAKTRARLERQKNLAMKEVEYLRAQMKSIEAEESEFAPDTVDETASTRIHELEDMVEQYRNEMQTLHDELSRFESQPPQSPRKREREDDDSESAERIGEMRRRAKTLQDEITQLQQRNRLLDAELKASTTQISSLKESRTRVLELRNNPTAEAEAIKMSTLKTLREENASLLAQLEGTTPRSKVVPMSSLDSLRLQLEEKEAQLKKANIKENRLMGVFKDKSLDFRQAVATILGWKLDFLPSDKVKATSILNATSFVDGDEEENSILFDRKANTMKVSGGDDSQFAREIRSLIEFWVEARNEIPCFLAACTLEFYDKTTRAQKM